MYRVIFTNSLQSYNYLSRVELLYMIMYYNYYDEIHILLKPQN